MIQFTIKTSQESHVSVLRSGKAAAYSSEIDGVVVGYEVLSSGHQRPGKVTCYPFSFPLDLNAYPDFSPCFPFLTSFLTF